MVAVLRRNVETLGYNAPSSDYGVLSQNDSLYPKKLKTLLGSKAPQSLYYKGNLELLKLKGVGFCGSRDASEKGLETAADCAEQIADEGIVVISGNAQGIDKQAHFHALQRDGFTIFVLPEGIEHFRIKKELEAVWDWNKVLVISSYPPKAPWQTYQAMDRNKIIVALSDAMIVIEAGEKGGTMEAGKATLRLGRPLYVVEYENQENALGNTYLLKKGASRLRKSNSTKKANLKPLLGQICESDSIPHNQPSFI